MTNGQENAGYERSDAAPRPLFAFLVILVVLIVVSIATAHWIASGLTRARDTGPPQGPLSDFRDTPEGPLLQAESGSGLAEHRAQEVELMSKYGWVDRENGVVRIPVERAMELLLERGLPSRPVETTPAEEASTPAEAEVTPEDAEEASTGEEGR